MLTATIANDRLALDLHGYTAEEHDRICRFEFDWLSAVRRLAAEWGARTDSENQEPMNGG